MNAGFINTKHASIGLVLARRVLAICAAGTLRWSTMSFDTARTADGIMIRYLPTSCHRQ